MAKPKSTAKKTSKTEGKTSPRKPRAAATNGSGLTTREVRAIRALLLEKRRELAQQRDDQLRQLTSVDKHHLADLEEMASDSSETDSFCEILDIGSSTVEQIDAALEKIVEGTYGICETCEEPIPRARLEALPFAGLCVNCQREKEKTVTLET